MEIKMATPCPICGKDTLFYTQEESDIPNFGRCLLTNIFCKSCGFRHGDIIILESHEPMRYELKIEEEEDLNARVIRSTSGTIRIPEIGAKIEPGPYSEAFITNVEGVLNRIIDILVQLMHTYPEKKNSINDILRKIGLIKHGKYPAKIIIDDPLGNSAIVSDKVLKRRLREEEIKNLKFGEILIDMNNTEKKRDKEE